MVRLLPVACLLFISSEAYAQVPEVHIPTGAYGVGRTVKIGMPWTDATQGLRPNGKSGTLDNESAMLIGGETTVLMQARAGKVVHVFAHHTVRDGEHLTNMLGRRLEGKNCPVTTRIHRSDDGPVTIVRIQCPGQYSLELVGGKLNEELGSIEPPARARQ